MAEMKPDAEQAMKLEQLYKVDPECKLTSWSNSLPG